MSVVPPPARPGAVVAFWEGGTLEFAVLVGEEKTRLRLRSPRGRERQVAAGRLVAEVAPPGTEADSAQAERVAGTVREAAASVDVRALWEIALESDAPAPLPLDELASLALGAAGGVERAAVVLALHEDGLHFVSKTGGWQARPAEAVQRLGEERARVARREAETREFLAALAGLRAGRAFEPRGTPTERRHLDALLALAAHEDAAPAEARQLALEALAASGLRWSRPHEGAFRLLRLLGHFAHDDENLQPLRFSLRTRFPDEVREHARRAARRGFAPAGRRDLTGLEAISIDGARTRELDDLIGVEPGGEGGLRVAVHIADPAAFVEPDDAVDREALARGLTYYMPDLRLPMLPEEISEAAASLEPGAERPALSFLVELDGAGRIVGWELARSVVRSRARLTYDDVDRTIAAGSGPLAELLLRLDAFGDRRQRARAESGAVILLTEEVDVHVGEDREPRLERLGAESRARRAVTEAMVLAGEIAARFCRERGLPVIYRRQEPADALPELPAGGVDDPVEVRRLRRLLRRAETGLEPRPHRSLGLAAYTQATSPLRRYQDLTTLRQIGAALAGAAPPFDVEAVRRIAASTEQAENDARRAEQAAHDYWILRYLESRAGDVLGATVVDLEPRPVVRLDEVLREQPLAGLRGVEPGQRLRLRIEQVVPRAGVLVLRPVG